MWFPRYRIPLLRFTLFNWLDVEDKPIPVFVPEPPPVILAPIIVEPKFYLQVANDFAIDTRDWHEQGDRDAILAQSGMGKSYLAGVLTEEIIESGQLVFIIDPEGENYTLAQKYPILIIGGEHKNSKFDIHTANQKNVGELVKNLLENGINAVLDLSDTDTEEQQQELFALFADAYFTAMDSDRLKRPVKLIVEEAHIFAPQSGGGNESNHILQKVAKRGRKRGLNLLVATQRPADLNKKVLSQCNRYWFGGLQEVNDLKAVKGFLSRAGILEDHVRSLKKGQFFYYAGGETVQLQSRKRKCKHGGATPAQKTSHRLANRMQLQEFLSTQ